MANNNDSTRMSHRLTFWRKEESIERDELNQHPVVDRKICTVWGSITPSGGNATKSYADAIVAVSTHKMVIRIRKDVSEDMWITDDMGNRYTITYISSRYDKQPTLELLVSLEVL